MHVSTLVLKKACDKVVQKACWRNNKEFGNMITFPLGSIQTTEHSSTLRYPQIHAGGSNIRAPRLLIVFLHHFS